ncbi:hypothetical protein M1563_03780 [Patescibacteria group bacterium]|nr:hypothetical protein [Patescibacteria group bacterium]
MTTDRKEFEKITPGDERRWQALSEEQRAELDSLLDAQMTSVLVSQLRGVEVEYRSRVKSASDIDKGKKVMIGYAVRQLRLFTGGERPTNLTEDEATNIVPYLVEEYYRSLADESLEQSQTSETTGRKTPAQAFLDERGNPHVPGSFKDGRGVLRYPGEDYYDQNGELHSGQEDPRTGLGYGSHPLGSRVSGPPDPFGFEKNRTYRGSSPIDNRGANPPFAPTHKPPG